MGLGLELGLEVWRWRGARPRLFVVVARVQQPPFELFGPAVLAAHELADDFLGPVVIVVGTRLVEIRFRMDRWPRWESLAHRGTASE